MNDFGHVQWLPRSSHTVTDDQLPVRYHQSTYRYGNLHP